MSLKIDARPWIVKMPLIPYSGLPRDSVSRDCGEDQFIENKDSQNTKQSIRFCTAEESRLNNSLELQMRKDLRRENEEEGRRLDHERGRVERGLSSDGKRSEI